MTSRLRNFYDLRAKGVAFRKALETSGIDWISGIYYAGLLVALLVIVQIVDMWAEDKAEERVAPHRAQAEENLKAFNHAMKGLPFVIENEWKALMTCKAMEVKL